MPKGSNIGEWSEIYTFLKLLADGVLFAADDNLEKIKDIYYPILSILREESGRKLSYRRNGSIKIVDDSEKTLAELPVEPFHSHAASLLKKIQEDGNESGSFHFPELKDFLKELYVEKIKAASRKKEDIRLVVHDFRTGLNPVLGFSIKSQLGGASTLLNPGLATNFVYHLERDLPAVKEGDPEPYGLSENAKLREKLATKLDRGYKFKFEGTGNSVFTANLIMIDTILPEILSHLVLYYYTGRATSIKKLTEILQSENPAGFKDSGHKFYEHKIKAFLMAVALGMTPATLWEGGYLASGGYIIVRKDGELVCYHIYNVDQFQEYLFQNTKLDTPQLSRYDYGDFYSEDGLEKIKLNLQVRFTK